MNCFSVRFIFGFLYVDIEKRSITISSRRLKSCREVRKTGFCYNTIVALSFFGELLESDQTKKDTYLEFVGDSYFVGYGSIGSQAESATFSEEISYRDENGAIVRLTTDKRALTPKQIVAVLQHTEWKTADNGVNIAADLTAALINQCLQPKRSLKGYFSLLSNSAHTNLRIDHFNAYLSGLEHLSSVNDGALAKRIDVNP